MCRTVSSPGWPARAAALPTHAAQRPRSCARASARVGRANPHARTARKRSRYPARKAGSQLGFHGASRTSISISKGHTIEPIHLALCLRLSHEVWRETPRANRSAGPASRIGNIAARCSGIGTHPSLPRTAAFRRCNRRDIDLAPSAASSLSLRHCAGTRGWSPLAAGGTLAPASCLPRSGGTRNERAPRIPAHPVSRRHNATRTIGCGPPGPGRSGPGRRRRPCPARRGRGGPGRPWAPGPG